MTKKLDDSPIVLARRYREWERKHTNRDPDFKSLTDSINGIVIETSDGRPPIITFLGVGYNANGIYGYTGLTEKEITQMKEDRKHVYCTAWTTKEDIEQATKASGEDGVSETSWVEIEGAKYRKASEAINGHRRIVAYIKKHGFKNFDDENEEFVGKIINGKL